MTNSHTQRSHIEKAILAGQIVVGMNFHEKVWALCARIPAGRVTTYAAIAHALGSKGYRAVGQALHHNPYAPAVPCHRVVGSDGRLTGFASGIHRKAQLLREEGVAVSPSQRADLTQRYEFDGV